MKTHDIKVAGVGGAGVRFVDRLAADNVNVPAVLAMDTDAEALDNSRASVKLQLGESRTNGFGAGGDPAIGRDAAEDDREMIRTALSGCKLVIVVAGLGGGTGSGALPIVLRVAREEGIAAFAFVTLPFAFEGNDRKLKSDHAFVGLRELCDGLIVVPNDRLADAANAERVSEAFDGSARILGKGVRSLWKLLVSPAYLSLSLSDLTELFRQSGRVCAFGYGEGVGPDRAAQAVRGMLGGPLLGNGRLLSTARFLVVNVLGNENLRVSEVREIMEVLSGVVQPDVRQWVGVTADADWDEAISVTALLSDQWLQESVGVAPSAAGAASANAADARGAKGTDLTQATLEFDALGNRGRFRNVEPTLLYGEDLDIPTFSRRRIALDR
jgi:cell division protein FtsZ